METIFPNITKTSNPIIQQSQITIIHLHKQQQLTTRSPQNKYKANKLTKMFRTVIKIE